MFTTKEDAPVPARDDDRSAAVDITWKIAIALGLIVAIFAPLALDRAPIVAFESAWIRATLLLFTSYCVRTYLASRYRPVLPHASDDALPSCTVIVPAYNEGAHVGVAVSPRYETTIPRKSCA